MTRIATLLAAALASFFLAACGPGSTNATTSTNGAGTTSSNTITTGVGARTSVEGNVGFIAPVSPKNYTWFTVLDDNRTESQLLCPDSVPGCSTIKRGDRVHVVSEVKEIYEPSWANEVMKMAIVESIN